MGVDIARDWAESCLNVSYPSLRVTHHFFSLVDIALPSLLLPPQLVELDFVPITNKDRVNAVVWARVNLKSEQEKLRLANTRKDKKVRDDDEDD